MRQQVSSKKKFLQGNKMYVALHNVPHVRGVTVVIHVLNKSLWLQTEKAGGSIAVIINNTMHFRSSMILPKVYYVIDVFLT